MDVILLEIESIDYISLDPFFSSGNHWPVKSH